MTERATKKLKIEKALVRAMGEPTPKQRLFHEARTRYVAYGGAKGGGKSHGVRQKATYLCFAHKGIDILIIRRTLNELEKNHVRPLLAAYAKLPPRLRPRYNEQKKVFTFPWGSKITLGYCDNENDVWQYQGQEYPVVFIDEATRLTEFQFRRINECVRGPGEFPKRTYLTCNPGGPGHFWVKRLFIDRQYHTNEDPEDFTFIQARVYDNAPLFAADPLYKKALKSYMEEHDLKEANEAAVHYARENSDYVRTLKMGSEDEQRAYLDGDWNVFSGLYFGEFDTRLHVCGDFDIPAHWVRSVSFDYGLDMLAALWFAADERGRCYCYRELNMPNLPISAAAAQILKQTGAEEVIHEYIAPPDLWNRRQDSGKSAAEIFADCGIPLLKAGNNRVQGWLNVKEWLRPREDGLPHLRVFKSCRNLIGNLKMLQYDETKKDDAATKPHEITHAPDALRYWCSLRQLKAQAVRKPPFYNFESERMAEEAGWGDVSETYLLY
jgi:phage terminase large subunit